MYSGYSCSLICASMFWYDGFVWLEEAIGAVGTGAIGATIAIGDRPWAKAGTGWAGG